MKKETPIAKLPPFTVTRVASTLSQSMGWQITNTRVPNTWNITKGENIRICIIDTGCPITKKNGMFHLHPDLIGSVDVDNSKSFVADEGIEDLNGHSTHCCGIIAAQNNSIGMIGVAPKATIVTYKALNKDGMGGMDQISDALECALKNKFDIISMSLGCPIGDDRMHDLVKKLFALNVVLVGAAGNDGIGSPVNYPAAYPEYIAVGAYDKNDSLAGFSCTGPELTIAAPGVDIYSTYLNDGYAVLSGTCLRGNTLIYTTQGPKQIKDMEIGDIVYCLDEKKLNIVKDECINLIDNGYKQLFKLTTDHSIIHATDNHPFFVLSKIAISNGIRKKYKREFVWKQLKDLNKNDLICTFKHIDNDVNTTNINNLFLNKHQEIKKLFSKITTQTQIPDKPLKISKDLCQFIGAYLGDGYIHYDKRNINNMTGVGLCIRRGYKQTNANLPSEYKKIFDESVGLSITERETGDLFIYSTYMANIFHAIGLGGDAHQKRMPSWCFELSDEYKAAIISGIIDSDGWITKRGDMGLQLCNLSLLQDIKMMLEMLGVKCANIKQRTVIGHSFDKENIKTYVSYYFISTQIKKIANQLCFFDHEYQKRINKKRICEKYNFDYCSDFERDLRNTQVCFEKIRRIDTESIEKVYDITIKNNHNFIADGLIVHNSMATPFMAGTIALLKSKHQKQLELTGEDDCITVDQVKEHIKKYATDKGIIGRDTYWGYGMIDVETLISAKETGPIVLTPEEDTYDSEDGAGKTWLQRMKDWFWNTFRRPFPPKEDIIDE